MTNIEQIKDADELFDYCKNKLELTTNEDDFISVLRAYRKYAETNLVFQSIRAKERIWVYSDDIKKADDEKLKYVALNYDNGRYRYTKSSLSKFKQNYKLIKNF